VGSKKGWEQERRSAKLDWYVKRENARKKWVGVPTAAVLPKGKKRKNRNKKTYRIDLTITKMFYRVNGAVEGRKLVRRRVRGGRRVPRKDREM